MTSAFFTRITPMGNVLLTRALALMGVTMSVASEAATIYGRSEPSLAGMKISRRPKRRASIENAPGPSRPSPTAAARPMTAAAQSRRGSTTPPTGVNSTSAYAQRDERAAKRREEADRQCDAADDQPGGGKRPDEIGLQRRDEEPGLQGHRDADSSAQQQEAEACPVAWIVENGPLLEVCPQSIAGHVTHASGHPRARRHPGGDPDITRSGDAALPSGRLDVMIFLRGGAEFFVSELDDAATHGDRHRFGPILGAELVDDVLEVGLDRVFRNLEQLWRSPDCDGRPRRASARRARAGSAIPPRCAPPAAPRLPAAHASCRHEPDG